MACQGLDFYIFMCTGHDDRKKKRKDQEAVLEAAVEAEVAVKRKLGLRWKTTLKLDPEIEGDAKAKEVDDDDDEERPRL